MTCEVAVMNKLGVALAADSAVTVNDGEKIYHRVDKIFPLSSKPPIALLIYGSAEIMGVPWEIVVKMYVDKFAQESLSALEDYASRFLTFVAQSSVLFPPTRQRERFREVVGSYWSERFFEEFQKQRKAQPHLTRREQQEFLLNLIGKENDDWSKGKAIEHFPSNFGKQVVTTYARELNSLENEMFGSELMSAEIARHLRKSVQNLYSRYWSASEEEAFPSYTGVVFAGMGEDDLFPIFQDYQVADMAIGRLRYRKSREARVTHDDSAHVVPLAQTDMIDLFYTGIHPLLRDRLSDILSECLSAEKDEKLSSARQRQIISAFNKSLAAEIGEKHTNPLIEAVDALPRYDLARMALALVSLTELRRKMAINESETVAGPINVALLSKRDGFVWVQREQRIESPSGFPSDGS
jgi:hypothetical protein